MLVYKKQEVIINTLNNFNDKNQNKYKMCRKNRYMEKVHST